MTARPRPDRTEDSEGGGGNAPGEADGGDARRRMPMARITGWSSAPRRTWRTRIWPASTTTASPAATPNSASDHASGRTARCARSVESAAIRTNGAVTPGLGASRMIPGTARTHPGDAGRSRRRSRARGWAWHEGGGQQDAGSRVDLVLDDLVVEPGDADDRHRLGGGAVRVLEVSVRSSSLTTPKRSRWPTSRRLWRPPGSRPARRRGSGGRAGL